MNFLFDIDSTLADDVHRQHLYSKSNCTEKWNYFYSLIPHDKPILPTVAIAQALQICGHTLIGLTGRRECSRALTEEWLLRYGIFFDKLYMRAKEDTSPNAEFKENALADIHREYGNIAAVFEDNPNAVAMFEKKGFVVFQVR